MCCCSRRGAEGMFKSKHKIRRNVFFCVKPVSFISPFFCNGQFVTSLLLVHARSRFLPKTQLSF